MSSWGSYNKILHGYRRAGRIANKDGGKANSYAEISPPRYTDTISARKPNIQLQGGNLRGDLWNG